MDIAINYFLKIGIDTLVVHGDGVDCYAVSFWKFDTQWGHLKKDKK